MRLDQCLAGVIVVGTLAACSGPLTRDLGSPFKKIDGLYAYGASGRDLRLSVRGNPFPLPAESFDKTVEAASQVQVMRAPTRLTLTPGPSARPGYEVAFLFSPSATQGGDGLCRGRIEEPRPESGMSTIHVLAVFCVSGLAETEVAGEAEATDPNDERFQGLIRHIVMQLFRLDLPDTGDGNSG